MNSIGPHPLQGKGGKRNLDFLSAHIMKQLEEAYQTMILGLLDLYRQYTFDESCIRQTYLLYC
jgi:hypothetical protein